MVLKRRVAGRRLLAHGGGFACFAASGAQGLGPAGADPASEPAIEGRGGQVRSGGRIPFKNRSKVHAFSPISARFCWVPPCSSGFCMILSSARAADDGFGSFAAMDQSSTRGVKPAAGENAPPHRDERPPWRAQHGAFCAGSAAQVPLRPSAKKSARAAGFPEIRVSRSARKIAPYARVGACIGDRKRASPATQRPDSLNRVFRARQPLANRDPSFRCMLAVFRPLSGSCRLPRERACEEPPSRWRDRPCVICRATGRGRRPAGGRDGRPTGRGCYQVSPCEAPATPGSSPTSRWSFRGPGCGRS